MAEPRFVKYGDKTMPIEAGLSLEQVKELMARHFPELAEPKIETKKEKDKTIYVFSKKSGRKGSCKQRSGISRRLHRRLLHDLQNLTAVTIVDARLVENVRDDRGSGIIAGDLARALDNEVGRVVDIRQALTELPNAIAPQGPIL